MIDAIAKSDLKLNDENEVADFLFHNGYRGRVVASLKGGNVYNAPEIQLSYVCSEWCETPNGKSIEKTIFENPSVGNTFTDKKGNVFTLDLPEKNASKLRPIDIKAMVEINREMLTIIEATTVKKSLLYMKNM